MLDTGSTSLRTAVNILGPMTVQVNGRPVAVTTSRLRTILAGLALAAGHSVPTERLASIVWGEDLPANVRRSLQTYVSRLRTQLGAEVIVTEPAGLRLDIEPDGVDAMRFERLLDRAALATDGHTERAGLAEALALWRGEPFEDVDSTLLAHTEAPRLQERYLAALERRIDLDIDAGRLGELIAELRQLTSRYPLRESLWVRLLIVLDRYGRQAEALECYESVRVRIAEELGVDPGPELRSAYADLLSGRAVLAPVVAASSAHTVVPRHLPADIDRFDGRATALKSLTDLIGGDDGAGRARIAAVTGTAGVGKTTLAVHWAHQVADRFPDGQLYVDLGGFGPAHRTVEPADAIRRFLDAFGVPSDRIPTGQTAQADLYRSLVAEQRVLIVLDNAAGSEHVRELLPGGAGCFTLITSRRQLGGLVAAASAQPVPLDLLSPAEARQMLSARLGPERAAAESSSVDDIVARCSGLPLALAIVAARAVTNPHMPLSTLVDELSDEADRLDALSGDEPATDVRTVFSWSYRALSHDAARVFPLLSLRAGPDVSLRAAASLAGLPLHHTRRVLVELTRAHLLTEHRPGRYTSHDLLRAYAAELTRRHHGDADRREATHRLLEHYVHTAYMGLRLLEPKRVPITVAPARSGVTPEELTDYSQAMNWFSTEHPALTAIVSQFADSGFDRLIWQLAWSLDTFLNRCGHWNDYAVTWQAALAAADRLDDRSAQAIAHRQLGLAYFYLYRHDASRTHFQRSLTLHGQLADRLGKAHTHRGLGLLFERQGHYADALDHNRQALELYEAEDHRVGQAAARNAIGWYHSLLGRHDAALAECERALRLCRELGDDYGQAATWDSLGYINHRLDRLHDAIDCYTRSVELRRRLGARDETATSLTGLGDAYDAAGEHAAARDAWRQALAIFDDLGHPDSAEVRKKLRRSDD